MKGVWSISLAALLVVFLAEKARREVIMRGLVFVLVALFLAPSYLGAQDKPKLEIGTRAGVSLVLPEEGSIINFALPGGGPSPLGSIFGGSSTVHLAFFATQQIMIEPQLSFSVLNVSNGASETLTTVGLTGHLAYLFTGATVNSPYIGFGASFFSISNSESDSDFAVGANVGYRLVPLENVAVRIEGAYRRWFDFKLNEINLAFVLGIVLN